MPRPAWQSPGPRTAGRPKQTVPDPRRVDMAADLLNSGGTVSDGPGMEHTITKADGSFGMIVGKGTLNAARKQRQVRADALSELGALDGEYL